MFALLCVVCRRYFPGWFPICGAPEAFFMPSLGGSSPLLPWHGTCPAQSVPCTGTGLAKVLLACSLHWQKTCQNKEHIPIDFIGNRKALQSHVVVRCKAFLLYIAETQMRQKCVKTDTVRSRHGTKFAGISVCQTYSQDSCHSPSDKLTTFA